jgi:hypothetical protein
MGSCSENIITFPESVWCLWCSLIIIASRNNDYDYDSSTNSWLTLLRTVLLKQRMVAEVHNYFLHFIGFRNSSFSHHPRYWPLITCRMDLLYFNLIPFQIHRNFPLYVLVFSETSYCPVLLPKPSMLLSFLVRIPLTPAASLIKLIMFARSENHEAPCCVILCSLLLHSAYKCQIFSLASSSWTSWMCSSLNVRDQIWYPYTVMMMAMLISATAEAK